MADHTIYTAPPNTGEAVLGKTLVDILDHACARYTNPRLFNMQAGDGWKSWSLDAFRAASEETALGLLDLGLTHGDHVAFYMESDPYFCIADMGCLLAGIVDVPIYLTSAPDIIQYVIEHAEAQALFVSSMELLGRITALLPQTPAVKTVIVAEADATAPALPAGMTLCSLDEVRARGRARLEKDPDAPKRLRARIHPDDLATIIYTSGTTGQPKGVMLTHENISFNGQTSFTGLKGYQPGPDNEVGISFLPMTHIFARAMHYGFLSCGTSVYFTTPDRLVDVMQEVRPTAFATVPRVLEKVYSRIQERMAGMTGVKRKLGEWALQIAKAYELGREPTGLGALKHKVADALVFKKWREALGGRVRMAICGGAALNGELANFFAAAGVPVLQGYGLTETSPVIAFNRPGRNRAGTVGEPLPGLEVMIAEDGEVLTRGPHVMKGYYKEEAKTREVLTPDGWFHTGDIGEFTADGYLRITDRKKDLFKLSTGKYVMPQPLENRLAMEGLVEHAVVVGSGHKFCTALIFPEQDALRAFAGSIDLDAGQPLEALLRHPRILAAYQDLVDRANEGMDHWSTIKRFALVPDHLTVENGLLTPTLKVKRSKVRQKYDRDMAALYDESKRGQPA